ncbi:putative F-box protein At1g65770 [Fagus crenata]
MDERVECSDLPMELLERIGKSLDTRIDVLRFCSVCNSWRSSIPSSSFHSNSPRFPHPRFPVLAYLCENPYRNRYEVVSLNLLDFRVLEFTKAYTLKCQCNCQPSTRGAIIINKVLKFPNSARTHVNDCTVFIVYISGILSFAKCEDENLTRVGDPGIRYEDIIVYEGLFYVVDRLGRVWWIRDPLELVEFLPRLPPSDGWRKYLVDSCGALYVVDRGRDCPKVYKMDRDKPEPWDLVNGLGDRAFVLGIDCCFSVSTEEFYGFKRNCIYFTDIRSVFNLEDDRFEYLAPLPNLL